MYHSLENRIAEDRERPAPRPPADRVQAALTPANVLALQRAGAGNQHIARAVLARVARPLRKAHGDIDTLLPQANVDQSAQLMAIRNAHLKDHGQRNTSGNLTTAEEALLAQLEQAILANPVVVPAPPVTTGKKPHVKGKVNPIDDALTVLKTGGRVESLAQAFLVAKLNTVGKRDLWIADGTTLDTVKTGALAQGYTQFEHVEWKLDAQPGAAAREAAQGKSWMATNWCTISLNKVGHASENELRADIQTFLTDRGFKAIDIGGPAVVVALGLTNSNKAELKAALKTWHPGIALDKTKRGQFRVDEPHPQVDNAHHSKHRHIHLQPPGGEQTTILFDVRW